MWARQARLADLSDVALMKRLRESRDWLYALCVELFREHGVAVSSGGNLQVRAFGATTEQDPVRTGWLWRPHDSVNLPSLGYDFFQATGTNGPGVGESFRQFRSVRATTCSPISPPRPARISGIWGDRISGTGMRRSQWTHRHHPMPLTATMPHWSGSSRRATSFSTAAAREGS